MILKFTLKTLYVRTIRVIPVFLITIVIFSCSPQRKIISPKQYAVKMADSDIKRNPEGWMLDFSAQPKWNYCHGLVCSALEKVWKATGDEKYYNYIKDYADTMIDEHGVIYTYNPVEYNIDKINSGKFLFSLYENTGEKKYENAIKTLREQMRTHPRTSEGGFWHKMVYPHQMWLDGLYIASPFLAQYAKTFGDDSLFNDVANQIHLIHKHLLDTVTGLYYHGWDESHQQKWADSITGLSPHFWGRGMGWFAMALVDVLDFFPADHPKRQEIIEISNHMAEVLVKYQERSSGLWYQVVDQAGREGNYIESSASAMFVYFLIKAVKNNYIDEKYYKAAKKGYNGILKHFITTNDDGTINIIQTCAGAGLGGNPYRDGSYSYYINERKRDNDPKAVGPFIMLSIELDKLKTK